MCLIVVFGGAAAAHAGIRAIAISGSPLAGTIAPEQFQRFDAAPVINNSGQVAFLAGPEVRAGVPYSGATSLWIADGSGLRLLATSEAARLAEPSQTPRAPFHDLALSDAGDVLFGATMALPPAELNPAVGIWQASPAGLQLRAEGGSRAAGFDEGLLHSLSTPVALAADGGAAYFGAVRRLTEPGPFAGGLWVASSSGTSLAARSGETIAPAVSDATFSVQSFGSPFADHPVVASDGKTVFRGFLESPTMTPDEGHGLWTWSPSEGLRAIALSGDIAPGDGRVFVSFPEPPAINDRGDVTFLAFVRPDQGDALLGEPPDLSELSLGIWSIREGNTTPRLRLGDAALGAPAEVVFSDFGRPLMNASGDLAILAVMEGEGVGEHNNVGIWLDRLDGYPTRAGTDELEIDPTGRLVARTGVPAPGVREDIVFQSFLEPALNNAGQVAFLATLAGPGISDAEGNVLGLWGQDRTGDLRLIARSGDFLQIDAGDVRQIGAIVFASGSGGQDGRPRGINDDGQLAFRVRFTDGTSAVLVSDVLSTPEPSAAALAIFALLFVVAATSMPRWWGVFSMTARRCGRSVSLGTFSFLSALTALPCPANETDYLLPDLIPFVREDQPYLQNWFLDDDLLRLETVVANVGDGLLQIRVDRTSASATAADVYQRVFIGTDNGPDYEDFLANRSVFHPGHGHFHLENFAEFQLNAVTVGEDGTLGVGDVVAATRKMSFAILDLDPLPDPQWADSVSHRSFNFGSYQNISVGWFDKYSHFTRGQQIDITGVDREPLYWLRQVVDPTNVLREIDDTNNAAEILIDLSKQSTAKMHSDGSFVQPGDFLPLVLGDLDFDQLVTLDDWSIFRAGGGTALEGLSDAQSYVLGDLNFDRRHSPADFLLFREAYEAFNGAGSAARLIAVPEPNATGMVIAALLAIAGKLLHPVRRLRFTLR